MEYYNDDFCDDYNEFDAQIEEFKESIKKGLKQEIKEKLERLEKENKELKIQVKDLDKLKDEYNRKMRNLDVEYLNKCEKFKKDLLRIPFEEFAKIMFETRKLYTLKVLWEKQPKCEYCDNERKVLLKDNGGREYTVDCKCSKEKRKFIIKDCDIWLSNYNSRYGFKFVLEIDNRNSDAYYDFNYLEFDNGKIIKGERAQVLEKFDISKLDSKRAYYETYFYSKEEAQKYADYLNNKENK